MSNYSVKEELAEAGSSWMELAKAWISWRVMPVCCSPSEEQGLLDYRDPQGQRGVSLSKEVLGGGKFHPKWG